MSGLLSESSAKANAPPFRKLVLACLASGAWVALWAMLAKDGQQGTFPFVYWDIALVSTLSWIPIGLVLTEALRIPRWLLGVLGAGLAFGSLFLIGDAFSAKMDPSLARWVLGAFVEISIMLLVVSFHRPREPEPSPTWPVLSLVLVVPLAAIVTSAYTAERIRSLEKSIGGFLSQYRLMEARELLAALQILDPNHVLNGMPLSMVTRDLDRELRVIREETDHLEKRLAKGGFTKPAEEQELRIEWAEKQAILGHIQEAMADLTQLTNATPQDTRALLLLATMEEHQEDWQQSLLHYEEARKALLEQLPSPERQSNLVQAWKGIAFSQRKRGHYREAEAAYSQVLKLAPTAEHHFLLAQFHQDAQRGDRAQFHADKAAELNPLSYRERADQLGESMQREQFGCWSIFRNRKP